MTRVRVGTAVKGKKVSKKRFKDLEATRISSILLPDINTLRLELDEEDDGNWKFKRSWDIDHLEDVMIYIVRENDEVVCYFLYSELSHEDFAAACDVEVDNILSGPNAMQFLLWQDITCRDLNY